MNKYAVIIAAGGVGKRFGKTAGKQFFKYKGKPLLIYTLEKFQGKATQLIVVIRKKDQAELKQYLRKYKLKVDTITDSGSERFDSIKNGLKALGQNITHVLIHDGARPNVSAGLIANIKRVLERYEAVIPVIPVTDTIKVVKNGRVVQTPARSELFQVQTPQGFKKDLLLKAYASVNLQNCTDDAMVVERYGQAVHTVAGEPGNIKITTFADLRYLV